MGELTKKLTDAAFYSYEKRGISKAAASALYGTIFTGQCDKAGEIRSMCVCPFFELWSGTDGASGVPGGRGMMWEI